MDAGPNEIAAILNHNIQGNERPVAIANYALTKSEQNYSQLYKEALAIIYGVTHFYNYLYGNHFLLVTNNELLTRIFHPDKSLTKMTSARLLRSESFLSGFNYSVRLKKVRKIQTWMHYYWYCSVNTINPDEFIQCELDEYYEEIIFQISTDSLTVSTIAKESSKEPELGPILKKLFTSEMESEYSAVQGILFRTIG